MTRDDIIRMAAECGIPEFENNESQADNIIRFANLVASADRELLGEALEAAKRSQEQISSLSALCETLNKLHETAVQMIQPAVEVAVHKERAACARLCDEHHGHECAAAIRARGER